MPFVELNRDFSPLRKDQQPGIDVGRGWGRKLGGWLSWPEILLRRRVIFLAEASSGKTEEFRNQQSRLLAEGKAAFFLRIEELAEQGFGAALSLEEATAFDRWREGTAPGWFFLDSIDEARLVGKSFDNALKRLSRELCDDLDRANIFISCRVTDWHGLQDYESVKRLLPVRKRAVLPSEGEAIGSGLLDPIFVEKPKAPASKSDKATSLDDVVVLQLVPLSSSQYQTLARSSGIDDVPAFVTAIEKNGLNVFTERPGDLLDLAGYWRAKRKFGTFADMVEHSISRKLAEPQTHRADNGVLSSIKACEGAEQIAAALTFGKSFTIRAPNYDPDPSLAAGAFDAASILPDWSDAERNALLRRGVFAPATYGQVRFHHRSTQEYLTAEWLHRLLQGNCPKDEIWALLFAERYGIKTVVPSLRPVAAWLARRHPDIRDEIIQREPLVLMQFGDPGSLPMTVRENLLSVYADKHAASEIVNDRWESRSLWMFADQALAPAIARAWASNPKPDFHVELVRLIRDGAIKDCSSLACEIALDESREWHYRALALDALAACGDATGLAAASQKIMKNPSAIDARLAAAFSDVLYPRYLTTEALLTLMRETIPAPKGSSSGFGFMIGRLYTAASNIHERTKLVAGLTDLCLSPPFIDCYRRISSRFRFLAKQLHEVAAAELKHGKNSIASFELVRLLMVIERSDRQASIIKEEIDLRALVRENSALSRALFWADIEEHRLHAPSGDQLIRFWQVHTGGELLWTITPTDHEWLIEQLKTRDGESDRRILLSAIMGVSNPGAEREHVASLVRPMIAGSAVLESELQAYLDAPAEDPSLTEHRARMEIHDAKKKIQTEKNKASWETFASSLRSAPSLLSDPTSVSSWKAGMFRYKDLLHWLQCRSNAHDEKALRDWRLLAEGFGESVAKAFREGLAHLWRQTRAHRPVHTDGNGVTVSWTTILAFGAIGVEAAEDSDWFSNLTPAEAQRAAEHGCVSEQGYPDWLDSLLIAFPQDVLPLVKKAVRYEWEQSQPIVSNLLHRHASASLPIASSVQEALCEIILKAEAGRLATLNLGVSIIRKLDLEGGLKAQLLAVARSRLAEHRRAKRHDFALRYLAILFLLDPDQIVDELSRWIERGSTAARKQRAEETFGALFDRHDPLIAGALERTSTVNLEKLLLLAYRHIHMKDDEVHEGSYQPNQRDRAEEARSAILATLIERPGADAYGVLRRTSDLKDFAIRAERFKELAKQKAERDTELPSWQSSEIVTLKTSHVAPIKTGDDLLRVVLAVLADIRRRLSSGDVSSRPLLERAKDEDEVQHWLVEQMEFMARGRYHAHREAQVAKGDKPDVIVSSTSADIQVAIEIKHGGKDWSILQLENALKKQLAIDYLKPEKRRHGVLVITHHRDRRWIDRKTKARITFEQLVDHLAQIGEAVRHNGFGEIKVATVGLSALAVANDVPSSKRSSEASDLKPRTILSKK